MSSTTTLGFPYAQSGDRVADQATQQQLLAQFVDDNVGLVKIGLTSVAFVGANPVDGATAVVFGTAFPAGGSVPRVVAVANVANPRNFSGVTISAVTRAGFTINVGRTGGAVTPIDVMWIAVAQ